MGEKPFGVVGISWRFGESLGDDKFARLLYLFLRSGPQKIYTSIFLKGSVRRGFVRMLVMVEFLGSFASVSSFGCPSRNRRPGDESCILTVFIKTDVVGQLRSHSGCGRPSKWVGLKKCTKPF